MFVNALQIIPGEITFPIVSPSAEAIIDVAEIILGPSVYLPSGLQKPIAAVYRWEWMEGRWGSHNLGMLSI